MKKKNNKNNFSKNLNAKFANNKNLQNDLQKRNCYKIAIKNMSQKNDLQNCVILPDDTNGPPGNAEI